MIFFERFAHGVHPSESKERTREEPIRPLGFAPRLAVSLSQHAGKPARPLVQAGDSVVRGQKIAEPDGWMSVALHAPATGRVRGVEFARSARGQAELAVLVEPTEASTQEVLSGAPCDPERATPKEILLAIQQAGLVGLGGAAFPTHVKLSVPPEKTVDALVVNGAECEPYLTTDYRVMLEQTQDVVVGIGYLLAITGASRVVIGIEESSRPAALALERALGAGLPVRVECLPVKYPQGAEKMLIHALLGRDVPSGKLPVDVGALCINVATVAEMGRLLPLGRGVQERVVTVSGPAVVDAGNYRIPIGTPLRFVLDEVGLADDVSSVIVGGPMMGASVADLDVPLTKGMSAVLAFGERDAPEAAMQHPCIRCGRCLEACPLSLNPAELSLLAQNGQEERAAEQLHLMDCFECGSCSFVCPAHIPLVWHFRAAKARLRRKRASDAAQSESAR